jgi:hypothetical protein
VYIDTLYLKCKGGGGGEEEGEGRKEVKKLKQKYL